MHQDNSGQGGDRDNAPLQSATRDEDPMAASDAPEDDIEFSNAHPLASPGELAGTADQALAAELAALGDADDIIADEQDGDSDALPMPDRSSETTTGDETSTFQP